MAGGFYFPTVSATLFVPTAGSAQDRQLQESLDTVYQFDIRPIRLRLVSNNHDQADECEVTFSYDECGVDPRYLRSAELYVYVQDAYAYDGFAPSERNLRFVGIARDVERHFSNNGEKIIRIVAHDYTSLFLEAKTYPASGVPSFSDTLTSAWQKICAITGYWDLDTHKVISTVDKLADRLEFHGDIDLAQTLGSVVPSRIAKLGKIEYGTGADTWAVWQACVQSLGLISFIRGDRCIVTTATDYFTADDPPAFLWGKNIDELKEARRLGDLSAKNVCVRAYDPAAGHILESLFPPPQLAQRKKRLGAAPPKHPPHVVRTQDYEAFDLPFCVSNQGILDRIAERIWEERTRQELSGELTTVEMFTPTVYGSQNAFDLLMLQAGDQIQVEIDRDALDAVQQWDSVQARAIALKAKGYTDQVANFIASNLDSIDKLPSQFLVRTVETEIQSTSAEGGGEYKMRVEFVNRIDITAGGTRPLGAGTATGQGDGENQTPIDGQSTAPSVPKTKLPT